MIYFVFDLVYILNQIEEINLIETNKEIVVGSRNRISIRFASAINKLIVDKKSYRRKLNKTIEQLDMSINNVAHDLRTPLTIASGYTQYLKNNKVSEDESYNYLNKIGVNIKKVEDRLELLLQYNRLSENRVDVNLAKVNLSSIINQSLISMYESFVEKEFEMNINIESEVYIISDKVLIERIVQNILGNVLMHGEKLCEVTLKEEDSIKIIVSNYSSKQVREPEKLKERFYTEDLSRKDQNAGLGLYIVDELTKLLNGKFDIKYNDNMFTTVIELYKNADKLT